MARFNEQMWPFFQLMQELEGVQLAPHLLEPTPAINLNKSRMDVNGSINLPTSSASGSNTGHRKNEYEIYKQGFTINIEGEGDAAADGTSTIKETPVWMQTSTLSPQHSTIFFEATEDQEGSKSEGFSGFSPKHQDIVNTLLVHESKTNAAQSSTTPTTVEVKSESVASAEGEEEEDEFEEVEDGDDQQTMTVTVQGKVHLLSDVYENPELLGQMTEMEKQNYIKLSQIAFQNMYGDD